MSVTGIHRAASRRQFVILVDTVDVYVGHGCNCILQSCTSANAAFR